MYRVVQKKGTVLLRTSLAWPAVVGCSWAETFSQLNSISFAQPNGGRAARRGHSRRYTYLGLGATQVQAQVWE